MPNSNGRPSRPAGATRRPFSSNGPRRSFGEGRPRRDYSANKSTENKSRFIYPDVDQGRTVHSRPRGSEDSSSRPARRPYSSNSGEGRGGFSRGGSRPASGRSFGGNRGGFSSGGSRSGFGGGRSGGRGRG